jgi:hypothetical protein
VTENADPRIEILIEYNGSMRPAVEMCWALEAPCGCVAGLTAVWSGKAWSQVISSERQAWNQMYPNGAPDREQARRDRAAGFTIVLGVKEACARALSEGCQCSPHWGLFPDLIPDGYAWARSKGERLHLVRLGLLENDEHFVHKKINSLCGKSGWTWTTAADFLDVPNCLLCIDLAKIACARTENPL